MHCAGATIAAGGGGAGDGDGNDGVEDGGRGEASAEDGDATSAAAAGAAARGAGRPPRKIATPAKLPSAAATTAIRARRRCGHGVLGGGTVNAALRPGDRDGSASNGDAASPSVSAGAPRRGRSKKLSARASAASGSGASPYSMMISGSLTRSCRTNRVVGSDSDDSFACTSRAFDEPAVQQIAACARTRSICASVHVA